MDEWRQPHWNMIVTTSLLLLHQEGHIFLIVSSQDITVEQSAVFGGLIASFVPGLPVPVRLTLPHLLAGCVQKPQEKAANPGHRPYSTRSLYLDEGVVYVPIIFSTEELWHDDDVIMLNRSSIALRCMHL